MRRRLFAYIFMAWATWTWMPLAAHADDSVPTGPARVDFDDRLVKGQRHGTGTVYIFERQKVELRSMVKRPHSFRQRIVITVFED